MSTKNVYEQRLLILGITLFIIVSIYFSQIDSSLVWDEAAYLSNARGIIGTSQYREPLRFPLLEYVIAGVWTFTGESIFTARMLVLFLSTLSILILYQIGKKLCKGWELALALSFGFSELVLIWGFRVYADLVSIFFLLAAWFFYLQKKRKFYLVSGVACGAAFLARYPLILFPLALGLTLLFQKEIKAAILLSTGFLVALLPWILQTFILYGGPWNLVFEKYGMISGYTQQQPAMLYLQWVALALAVLLPLFLLGLVKLFKEWKTQLYIILFIFFTTMFHMFFSNLKLPRYVLPILPFLLLISCWGSPLFQKIASKKFNLIPGFLFLLLMIFSLQYATEYSQNRGECFSNSSFQQAVDIINEQKEVKGHSLYVISEGHWPHIGYLNNVKSYSAWSTDYSEYTLAYGSNILFVFKDAKEDPRLGTVAELYDSCEHSLYIYEYLN